MFAQGGRCFFCDADLPKAEASVEHLVAKAKDGSNSDDNCVVCCKSINTLLGSMSLKEKIKVVLNQKGQFKCPNGAGTVAAPVKTIATQAAQVKPPPTHRGLNEVIAILKGQEKSRPRKLKTLTSAIKSLANLKLSDKEVEEIIQLLQSRKVVAVEGTSVTYKL
ncbi:MAG: HNH endonuclease signature motif containing protein [Pseudomonadota bacterium]